MPHTSSRGHVGERRVLGLAENTAPVLLQKVQCLTRPTFLHDAGEHGRIIPDDRARAYIVRCDRTDGAATAIAVTAAAIMKMIWYRAQA
jgi:hypothetical protein